MLVIEVNNMRGVVVLRRKISRFLRRIGCPRWLHRFGPKTYETSDHLLALLMMQSCRLSLRRAESLLSMFSVRVPSYSALCKRRKAIPPWIWSSMLRLTSEPDTVAMDSTGFSRTNPSHHYMRRIGVGDVRGYAKMSILFSVSDRMFAAVRVHVRPIHDIKDARRLLSNLCPRMLLADKAYDAEWLHEMCYRRGVQTLIPSKVRTRKGLFRKIQRRGFTLEAYHQRSLVESAFSAMKRKYGGSVLGKSLVAVKSELLCRALAYNLRLGS